VVNSARAFASTVSLSASLPSFVVRGGELGDGDVLKVVAPN
jgi:hypothetical protein